MINFVAGFVAGGIIFYLVGLNRNRKTAKDELAVAQAWTARQVADIHKKIDELIAKYKGN